MAKVFYILLAVMLLVPVAVLSATLRVEQDGSGDFTVIMHAVYAASAGDTILIGPGEYRNFVFVQPPGWSYFVRIFVYVTQPDLTFIGVGASDVIIGSEIYDPGYPANDPFGFMFIDSSNSWQVSGVTVENCLKGIASHTGGKVSGSVFRGGDNGISLYTSETVTIQDCEFWDHGMGGGIISFDPCVNTVVQNCRFNNSDAYFADGDNIQILDCEFNNDAVGIQFFSSTGTISGCKFFNQYNYGIAIAEGSDAVVRDCEVRNDSVAITVWNRSTILAEGNIFEGQSKTAYLYGPTLSVEFSGNHILCPGGSFVETHYFPGTEGDVILNFENNYWGTTSADSIAEGIWDMNDDPEVHAIVDFEPFSSEPLPAEPTSWGDLKSMFR